MLNNPLDVVRTVLDRLNAEDWSGAAELFDGASLSAFHRYLVQSYNQLPAEMTVDDYLRFHPDMPREFAEYQLQQRGRFSVGDARVQEEIADVTSVEDLERLAPREAFALWLKGHSPRTKLDRFVQWGRLSRAHADEALMGPRWWPDDIIGVVQDGDRIAHVLYRFTRDPEEWTEAEDELRAAGYSDAELEFERDRYGREQPQIVSCRRAPAGQWRLIASEDVFGIGGMMLELSPNEGDHSADFMEAPGAGSRF